MTATQLTLTSCADLPTNARVQIKDKLFYTDKGPLGAFRYHSETPETLKIPFDVWNSLDGNKNARFGMTCMSAETLGQFKKELEVVCSNYGRCDHPDVVAARAFIERAQRFANPRLMSIPDTEILE